MKIKFDKELGQALMAIGAGLAIGTELWYLDFKSRTQQARNAVVDKEIENMLKLIKSMDDDIREMQDKLGTIWPEDDSPCDEED